MMMMVQKVSPIKPKEVKERFILDTFRIIRDEFNDDQAFYDIVTATKLDYEMVDGQQKTIKRNIEFTQENKLQQIIQEFLDGYKVTKWNWTNELLFHSIKINVLRHKLKI